MIPDQTTYQQALIILISLGCMIAIPAFYFLIIKPKQHEKAKSKRKSTKDIVPPEPDTEPGLYDQIINDFPTYIRQDGV